MNFFQTFLDTMLYGAIVVIVVGFVLGYTLEISDKKGEKIIKSFLDELDNFTSSQECIGIGSDGKSGIAFDEERKEICLMKSNDKHITYGEVFLYKDILSIELFVNKQSVTKSARGSQLGGVLIGGLALGGVGAIIGGLSGKTVTTDEIVGLIELRMIVNNTNHPIFDVVLWDMQKARHWHALISVLIKQADTEDSLEAMHS